MNARIVDAGPLLFLSRLDKLSFLRFDVEDVYVPSAVITEIQQKPDDPALTFISYSLASWLKECKDIPETLFQIMSDIGAGEREVICQAINLSIQSVVLDDMDARRKARQIGLKPIGTVGLLLAGKKRGLISLIKPELQKLKNMDFRISKELWQKVLIEAGEL